MDVIETAIRNAFEKGNADDRAFREKVYRSAFAALDRALKANPGVTVELAISRRKNLQSKITEIESEFIPAVPAVAIPPRPAPAPPPVVEVAPPVVAPPRPAAPVVEPVRPVAPAAPVREAAPMVTVELDDAVAPVAAGRHATVAPVAPAVVAPPVSVAPPVVAARAAAPEPVEPDFDIAPEPMAERMAAPEPTVAPARNIPPDILAVPTIDRPLAGSAPVREPALEPVLEAQLAPGGNGDFAIPAQNEPAIARERRGRPLVGFFVALLLAAIIGGGGWYAVQSGLIKLPDKIGGTAPAQPAPPQTAGGEDYDPGEEDVGAPALPGEADARDWVSVFTPTDPALVSAPGDTKAEVMQDDSGNFIRIRSSASGSAIVFDVGQGVLEKLAGKKAAFDIVARASEEGKDTQISVICNFGELGGCGRKRYAVGITKADYLFEIELPAKSPGAGGTIAINSDIDGGAKAIDIYEIKVAVSQ